MFLCIFMEVDWRPSELIQRPFRHYISIEIDLVAVDFDLETTRCH